MKSGMADIISNWFFYGQITFENTIFPTLIIYGIVFLLCKLWKNGWFLTKQPLMNHVFYCLIINFVIAGLYIYTLPIKIYERYHTYQRFRLYDNIPITSLDAIELFGLYVITMLIAFFIANSILKWYYMRKEKLNDELQTTEIATEQHFQKSKHHTGLRMNRKIYWLCFFILLVLGGGIKSCIINGSLPPIWGWGWGILLFILAIVRATYMGYTVKERILICILLFVPLASFFTLMYLGCKNHVNKNTNNGLLSEKTRNN